MEVIERIQDTREIVRQAERQNRTVGLVPTMGALHEGHLSLVRKSVEDGCFTVVSIFVNPTQFGPSEDFSRYPRTFEADLEKCRQAGVDLVFAPSVEEMYPSGFGTYVEVQDLTEMLEGKSRPGHFRGVTTVVLKLFTAVEPDKAYFGMKDYQQTKVIQKMVRDLNLGLVIIPVPTFRGPDGLAMSSRNAYLSPEERKAATVLYRALQQARSQAASGLTDAEAVRQAAVTLIETEPLASVDYVAVVDSETLQTIQTIECGALMALAVLVGKTRLIDNILL